MFLTLPLVFCPAVSNAGEIVELPPPQIESKVSVEQALLGRRSIREFAEKDLTWDKVRPPGSWACGKEGGENPPKPLV
jgi:hypothetical protein